jgi:hypothetical protein
MTGLINMLWGYYEAAKATEEAMCKEFEQRAEEARQKYWDACKYSRKVKKRMRKEAKYDFRLYSTLSKRTLFT